MAKTPQEQYEEARQRRHRCTLADVETLHEAWGFERRRTKGHTQVWSRGPTTLTLHRPHGPTLKAGAVRQVLQQIDAAEALASRPDREPPEDAGSV